MGFKVCKKRCDQCLLSDKRVVSQERKDMIIEECIETQSYFICHKTDDTCCRGFFDKYGEYSQMVRIAGGLNQIDFV